MRTLPHSWSIAIRALLGIDFLLIALSFTEWFSGNATHAGFADRLFGPISGDGFRLDFLYILLSSLFALVMFLVLVSIRPLRLQEKFDAMLCLVSILATIAFIHHVLVAGLLYFG